MLFSYWTIRSLTYLILILFLSCSPLSKYSPKDWAWALPEIRAFEKLDQNNNYPNNAILFLGSSSIRLWKTLKADMKPHNVIQRGYGGAHFRDLIFFTERILSDHSLKMIVCFVANDISGSSDDESPRKVLRLYQYFINQVRSTYPKIPIIQISITPTQSRWYKWNQIRKLNGLIEEFCKKNENLFFLDTVPEFLDLNGKPKPELFVSDKLHLNEMGYSVWNKIIRSKIDELIPMK